MHARLPRRQAVVAMALACVLPFAQAQGYPAKPVRSVVPQPPGGGFDTVGRLIADRMGKVTGQAFVVEMPGKPMALIGDDARAVVRRDVEHWSRLVKTLGLRAE